jgi:hypothetical protein
MRRSILLALALLAPALLTPFLLAQRPTVCVFSAKVAG